MYVCMYLNTWTWNKPLGYCSVARHKCEDVCYFNFITSFLLLCHKWYKIEYIYMSLSQTSWWITCYCYAMFSDKNEMADYILLCLLHCNWTYWAAAGMKLACIEVDTLSPPQKNARAVTNFCILPSITFW